MSIVVRDPSGKLWLYTKGADAVIFPRLRVTDAGLVETTKGHLETFANSGLRTLSIAMRSISEGWYHDWSLVSSYQFLPILSIYGNPAISTSEQ